MDYDSSTKFISSLAKFLQSLCNGYVEFDNGVEVIGHIYLSVDTGKKIDYILNEKVCKTDENSVTFISNSFHAQPAEKPKPASKKSRTDPTEEKVVDGVVEIDNEDNQVEPRSTNSGTVPHSRNPHSPSHRQGKRPFSPHSKRGSSPGSKKNRNDFQDQGAGIGLDNSISSPSLDPLRGHPGFQPDTNYSQSYGNGFNPPIDSSADGEERDIKPSMDTDVTFVKEEFTPTDSQIDDDRNQGDDASFTSVYHTNQSYAGGGSSSNLYGQQNSRLSYDGSGERSDFYDPGMGTSQMDRNDGAGDQSVANQLVLQLNSPDSQEEMTTSLCHIGETEFKDDLIGRRRSKWADRVKRYSCQYCWKSFVVRRDCEGHVNSVHLKVKPFSCEFCHWSSSHKGELQKHLKKCRIIFQFNSKRKGGKKGNGQSPR